MIDAPFYRLTSSDWDVLARVTNVLHDGLLHRNLSCIVLIVKDRNGKFWHYLVPFDRYGSWPVSYIKKLPLTMGVPTLTVGEHYDYEICAVIHDGKMYTPEVVPFENAESEAHA